MAVSPTLPLKLAYGAFGDVLFMLYLLHMGRAGNDR
jgi:hypothetical protein